MQGVDVGEFFSSDVKSIQSTQAQTLAELNLELSY